LEAGDDAFVGGSEVLVMQEDGLGALENHADDCVAEIDRERHEERPGGVLVDGLGTAKAVGSLVGWLVPARHFGSLSLCKVGLLLCAKEDKCFRSWWLSFIHF